MDYFKILNIGFFFQAQDDKRDQCIKLEDILPTEPLQPISYDTLLILLGKPQNDLFI